LHEPGQTRAERGRDAIQHHDRRDLPSAFDLRDHAAAHARSGGEVFERQPSARSFGAHAIADDPELETVRQRHPVTHALYYSRILSMIRALVWDLGGVLCRFRPQRRAAEIARRSGCSIASVDALLDRPTLAALDRGALSGAGLHARVRDELAWDCSYDELGRAWSSAFDPDPGVLALADRVARPAAVLSHNGPPLADQFARLLPAVASVVPVAVFSADVGYTKPHRGAFHAACARLGLASEQVLLVDDNPVNVTGAADVGLHAVQYTNVGELTDVLANLGLFE